MTSEMWRLIRSAGVGLIATILLSTFGLNNVGVETAGVQPDTRKDWLYVVDSNDNAPDGRLLLVDPAARRVIREFRTGYQPDAVLSSTTSHLYLASSYTDPNGRLVDTLEVLDTATGTIIHQLDNPYRALSTLPIYSSRMALSGDGRWIFQFKMSQDKFLQYFVDVFDISRRVLLPRRSETPLCSMPVLLTQPASDELRILCDETHDLRRVQWRGVETAPSADHRIVLQGGDRTNELPALAFMNRKSQELVIISGDGKFIGSHALSTATLRKGLVDAEGRALALGEKPRPSGQSEQPNDWLRGRWIPQQRAVLSSDGSRLYVHLAQLEELKAGRQSSDQIVVLDTQTLRRVSTITPSRTFNSIEISSNGERLYAIDPSTSSILTIQTADGRELGIIEGVGTTPLFALAAN